MLLLQTFLDESGHARDRNIKVLTLAGAISPVEQWESLLPKWQAVLDEFKVASLHMREYAHSVGQYEHWKYKETKRQAFMANLTDLVLEHTAAVCGVSLPLELFQGMIFVQKREYRVEDDPYYICLLRMVWESALEGALLPQVEKVQIIAAKHPQFTSKAGTLYQICLNTLPTPLAAKLSPILGSGSPARAIQLQVADLIAYEYNRLATDGLYNPGTDVRWPMRRLLAHPNSRIIVFTESLLRPLLPIS